MAADKDQLLINEVITVMQTITDFNNNVKDFEMNWDESELPAMSVFDMTTDHQLANGEPEASSQTNTVNLTLQIFVKSGTRAATLRALIKKVREKLRDNRTLSDIAMWTMPRKTTKIVEPSADPVRTSFEVIGASLEYEVAVSSDAFEF